MVVIDAGRVGGGETAVTTAHLSSVIDDTFKEMLRLHGPDGARLAYESHAQRDRRDRSDLRGRTHRLPVRARATATCSSAGTKESTLDEELEAARAAGARVTRLPQGAGHGLRQRTVPAVPEPGAVPSAEVPERARRRVPAPRRTDLLRHAARSRPSAASGALREDGVRPHDHARARSSSRPTRRSTTSSPSTRNRRRTTPTRSARASPPARSRRRSTGTPRIPTTTSGCTGRPNRELGGDNDDPVDILIVGGEDHKAGQAQDAERALRAARGLDARALPRRRARSSSAGPGR